MGGTWHYGCSGANAMAQGGKGDKAAKCGDVKSTGVAQTGEDGPGTRVNEDVRKQVTKQNRRNRGNEGPK